MDDGAAARADRVMHRARCSAFPAGEYVGQESFMRASAILALARHAGVGPGTHVLDLCCGTAGPGLLITRQLGCDYLGVDRDPFAIDRACRRTRGMGCRFATQRIPPCPSGPFDVVLLFETMLAFSDKAELVRAVSAVLAPGGRFAFTLEEGTPLTNKERARMPDADTVWPVPWSHMRNHLEAAGLRVRRQEECTREHVAVVDRLRAAYAGAAAEEGVSGQRHALETLVAGHRLWAEWLRSGRVRKFAIVAEKQRG